MSSATDESEASDYSVELGPGLHQSLPRQSPSQHQVNSGRFRVLGESVCRAPKFQGTKCRVQLEVEKVSDNSIPKYLQFLTGLLYEIAKKYLVGLNRADLVRICLDSPNLQYFFSTPFVPLEAFDPSLVLQQVESRLNSNQEFLTGTEFTLHIESIKLPKGGRPPTHLKYIIDPKAVTTAKQCIIQPKPVGDNLCLYAAFLVAHMRGCFIKLREKVNAVLTGNLACSSGDYEILIQQKKQADAQFTRMKRRNLTCESADLYRAVNGHDKVPDTIPTIEDVKKIETYFNDTVAIVVYGLVRRNCLYRSKDWSTTSGLRVALVLDIESEHFHVLTTEKGFLGVDALCNICFKGYNPRHPMGHPCFAYCKQCQGRECGSESLKRSKENAILCSDCSRVFYTPVCFEQHKVRQGSNALSACVSRRKCLECGRLDTATHDCLLTYCPACRETVTYSHRCFVKPVQLAVGCNTKKQKFSRKRSYQQVPFGVHAQPSQPSASAVANAERRANEDIPQPSAMQQELFDSTTLFYWDTETVEGHGKTHNVVMIVVESNQDDRQRAFTSLAEFCKFALTPANHGAVFIAHNAAGFDNHLIYEFVLNKLDIKPVMTRCQGRIMKLEFPAFKIRFLCSFCFIQAPLAKLPSIFGVDEAEKSFYPFQLINRHGLDYIGPFPSVELFEPNKMSGEREQEFWMWYRERAQGNRQFNALHELEVYCGIDTRVLKRCFEVFRRLVFDQTCIDPTGVTCTIAGLAMGVFRSAFLSDGMLALTTGIHTRERQSSAAIAWLLFRQKHYNQSIQHGRNMKEYKIFVGGRRFKVDGMLLDANGSPTKTVFEFYGCYHHACPICHDPNNYQKQRMLPMHELYDLTITREMMIESAGYEIISIWEHSWKKLQANDQAVVRFMSELELPPMHLEARMALYGGRVEVFSMYREIQEGLEAIEFSDVNSLYPWIMWTLAIMLGQPKRFYGSECKKVDLNTFNGLVLARWVPPQDHSREFYPILPQRIDNRLVFALCRTCAEQCSSTDCNHTVYERSWIGVYTSLEAKYALESGYSVFNDCPYEVWTYTATSDKLFKGYIRKFYTIKLHAKGWPEWVKTEADQQQYIKIIHEREQIDLDARMVKTNKGLYSLSKYLLNSLWGKFAQKHSLERHILVDTPDQFYKYICDSLIEIKDVSYYAEGERALISYVNNENQFDSSGIESVVTAAFITAAGRHTLTKKLRQLTPNRGLYCDTDSIIYVERTPFCSIPHDPFLGGWDSELAEGDYIKVFAACGPKAYSFITAQGCSKTKVKGISLNSYSRPVLNFESMRKLVVNREFDTVLRIPQGNKIVRNLKNYTLYTAVNEKNFRIVYTKRQIQPDLSTLPWGFNKTYLSAFVGDSM